MKIKDINMFVKNNKAVLSGNLVLNSGKTHNIYFEVDKEFKDYISKDASPFLAAGLPIAMQKKEELEIINSISKHLIKNTSKIKIILKDWNVGFNEILINAKVQKLDSKTAKDIGCFFSGGADSFYTYLKNKDKINYLVFVHGFDIKESDIDLYKKIEKNIIKIAKKEKIKLIKVKTNIRETFEQYFDWNLSHPFAIAGVALFLRNGLNEIFASCGLPNKNTDHHFMTPELDKLWSTETLNINHYGCEADKILKLKLLSHHKIAMENLRVCWVNKNKEYNCSECEKCFRNMLALYATNSLEKCKTFNKKINLERLKKIRIGEYNSKYFVAVLETLKKKKDTTGVRFALEECINNNKFPKFHQRLYRNGRDFIRFFDKKYNKNRFYWLLASRGLIH